MQYLAIHARVLTIATLVTTLAFSTSTLAQDTRTGTIDSIQGDVMIMRGETRQPAQIGGSVVERDRIVTGPASAAALTLRDGTAITVGPSSSVDLTSFKFESQKQEGDMVIGLLKGSMRFITGLLGKKNPEKVSITTPTATIGIRGTDFILEVQ